MARTSWNKNKSSEGQTEVLETKTSSPEITDAAEPIAGDDVPFIDLKELLNQETEEKVHKPGSGSDSEDKKIDQGNESDFEPEKPEATQKIVEPQEEPEPEPEFQMSYGDQAELIVGCIDVTGYLLLPPGYKAKIFTKEEKKLLPELEAIYQLEKIRKKEEEKPEHIQKVWDKFKRYKMLVDNVEFSKQEKDSLTKPLAAVLEKYKIKSGPEFSLVMAALLVMGPRVSPLFFE